MGMAMRGLTHCEKCGQTLSMNEFGICNACRKEDVKNKENTIHHVTISTEKLKQLINQNYKWSIQTILGKIEIVRSLAHFDSDKELLEFLLYMEE